MAGTTYPPETHIDNTEDRLHSMEGAVERAVAAYKKYETFAEHPSSDPNMYIPVDLMDALGAVAQSFPGDLEYCFGQLEKAKDAL